LSTEKSKWLSVGGSYEENIDQLLPFEKVDRFIFQSGSLQTVLSAFILNDQTL